MNVRKLDFVLISGSNDKYKKHKIIYIAHFPGFYCGTGSAYYQISFSNFDPNMKWIGTLFMGCEPRSICNAGSLDEAITNLQKDYELRILSNIEE